MFVSGSNFALREQRRRHASWTVAKCIIVVVTTVTDSELSIDFGAERGPVISATTHVIVSFPR